MNHTNTLGVVVLLLISVGKDLDLGPASSPCWSESCLYPFGVRRALQQRQVFIDIIHSWIK